MPIKIICAWCKADLTPHIVAYSPREVSHTMCDRCLQTSLHDDPISLRRFLDKQQYPILLVDGGGVVLAGNDKAESRLGKALGDMQGLLAGDVIDCVNATDPGGCGQTPNCTLCEFRRSFEHTHRTGQALVEKPVALTVRAADGSPLALDLTLSTRKVGSAVFITVHALVARPARS